MTRTSKVLMLFVLLIFTSTPFFIGCGESAHKLSTSVAPSGGGSVSPANGVFKGSVTLVATPSKYYDFEGWAGEASGDTNPLTVKMNKDKHIVASFKKKIYTLQINSSVGGTVQPNSGQFEGGVRVQVIATPASGYRFDHWGGGATGTSNPTNVLMDSDKNITAYFVKQYVLQLTVDPIEGGNISPEAGVYDEGTKITLNTISSFPYYPSYWVGTDDNSAFPSNVTMNKDVSVSVQFALCTEGERQTKAGAVSKDGLGRWGPVSSVPIQLKRFDWIQGEIIWQTPNTPNTPVGSYIQDPDGSNIKDFGSSMQSNFKFMAETTGTYTIVFKNNSIWYADYHLNYTIWTH